MLANTRRLNIIHHLIDKEPLTLTQLVMACKMSLPACSQYTRQITARGLCRETRKGRYAFFDLNSDPAIPYSATLLQSVIISLKTANKDYKKLMADLTAYTHVSRIRIVNYISTNGSARLCDMQRTLHISESALLRHIDKLLRRHVIVLSDDECYHLAKSPTLLAKELKRIVTEPHLHTS
jgi:predicted transcriptional regulator